MKPSLIIFIITCAGIAAAAIYLNRSHNPSPAPVAATTAAPGETAPPETAAGPATPPPAVAQSVAAAPAPAALPLLAAAPAQPAPITNAITQAVDSLLHAKSGREKHELLQQLVRSGQIDQVITELQQRAAANQNDPEIPTTLAEAMLNKVSALYQANGGASGAPNDEIGILAMQADQQLNAALKIDPQNWEAQFVKASSMYYWPSSPQTDNDTVQRLSSLIDQQQTMASQPYFAQPYVVLGNEYQKLGQTAQALATWQLGLSIYPNDPTLQQKVAGGGN